MGGLKRDFGDYSFVYGQLLLLRLIQIIIALVRLHDQVVCSSRTPPFMQAAARAGESEHNLEDKLAMRKHPSNEIAMLCTAPPRHSAQPDFPIYHHQRPATHPPLTSSSH